MICTLCHYSPHGVWGTEGESASFPRPRCRARRSDWAARARAGACDGERRGSSVGGQPAGLHDGDLRGRGAVRRARSCALQRGDARSADRGVQQHHLPAGSVVTRILPQGPRRPDGSAAFVSGACVYLPPGYATSGLRYPVVYLLHGGGGDQGDWVAQGSLQETLDAAAAAGHPVIAVTPDGRSGQWFDYNDGSFQLETYVLRYLIPYVDRHSEHDCRPPRPRHRRAVERRLRRAPLRGEGAGPASSRPARCRAMSGPGR